MRKGRLRPGLHEDLEGLFEVGAIALLVLDGGAVAPAPGLCLPRLVTAADAELQPATADHIQHRRLLSHAQRMPPRQDVGHLAEADALRPGRDRGLCQERAGAELRPFGHEVMLGHEPVVIAEPVRQDPLPYLADEDALVAPVYLLQR